MTTKDAEKLGRAAYHAERMRVPAWDSELMADPSHKEPLGTGGKTSRALMAAWLQGWDSACCAAMMEPMPGNFGA